MAEPLREGAGPGGMAKRVCHYEKKNFFGNIRKKFLWPLSRGGAGAKGLSGRATKKELFQIILIDNFSENLCRGLRGWGEPYNKGKDNRKRGARGRGVKAGAYSLIKS